MSSADQIEKAYNEELQVDDQLETWSDYSESLNASSTQSLSSELKQFTVENGRQFHVLSEGKYDVPTDETEKDRLDLYHHLKLLMLDGKLHLAPLENPQRILDVGTGTGVWAIDIADTFPAAEVIGVDIAPIQPNYVVRNVRFEIDDVELDWTYRKDYFDFIHVRTLSSAIKDWSRLVGQIYEHLAPGGWVELSDYDINGIHSDDGSLTESHALSRLFKEYVKTAATLGINPPTETDFVKWLTEAGFKDIEVYAFKQPWGAWPKSKRLKQIGRIQFLNGSTGLESFCIPMLSRYAGYTHDDATKFVHDAVADFKDPKVHAWNWQWHVVGRKPAKKD